MPRKQKGKVFKGTKAQDVDKKKQTSDDTAVDTAVPNVNTVSIADDLQRDPDQLEVPEASETSVTGSKTTSKSISEKKIEHFTKQLESQPTSKSITAGYRLIVIDLECLNTVLKAAHRCKHGEN